MIRNFPSSAARSCAIAASEKIIAVRPIRSALAVFMTAQYTAPLIRHCSPADISTMAFTPEQLQELGTQANAAATAPRQTTKERRAVQRSAMGRQIKVVVKRAAGPQAIEAWFNDLSMHGLGLVSTQPLNIGD